MFFKRTNSENTALLDANQNLTSMVVIDDAETFWISGGTGSSTNQPDEQQQASEGTIVVED